MTSVDSNNGHAQNGHGPAPHSDVDQHFALFRSLYENANQSWYVRKLVDSYDYGKQTLRLEPLLNPLEERVAQASTVGLEHAAPLYESYVYPKTDYLFHNIVVPGVESSKVVLEKSKNVASTGGTMGLSTAVVLTQAGLIASAASLALFLDGIILTKKAGLNVAGGAVALEKSIEQKILNAIERSRILARVPVDKFNEFTNSFIDILNAVLDNHLHLPIEEEDVEGTDSSHIGQRVSRLARRVLYALKNRTNESLVQPVQNQLHNLVDQLKKSLQLVDTLKQQRHHLQSSVNDLKTKLTPGHLSESMHELWSRLEKEAQEYKISPEEALIRSVKRLAFILNDYLKKLKQQTNEILPEPASQRLDSAAAYVEELNSNLEHSNDIFEVKEEVLQQAKQKLDELVSWSANLVNRNGESNADSNGDSHHSNVESREESHHSSVEPSSEFQHSNGTANHNAAPAEFSE